MTALLILVAISICVGMHMAKNDLDTLGAQYDETLARFHNASAEVGFALYYRLGSSAIREAQDKADSIGVELMAIRGQVIRAGGTFGPPGQGDEYSI